MVVRDVVSAGGAPECSLGDDHVVVCTADDKNPRRTPQLELSTRPA